jgi:hypothetical protein
VNGVMVRGKVKPDRARLTGGPASIAPAPGAATLALAAVSWVVAVDRMAGMDMGVATEVGSAARRAERADSALTKSTPNGPPAPGQGN